MSGHGKYTWPEGSVYDGMWFEGQMTGQGRFENAFDGLLSQGEFYRNCFRQHDGSWFNVNQKREEQRLACLQIGALGPDVAYKMPVAFCTSAELSVTMNS